MMRLKASVWGAWLHFKGKIKTQPFHSVGLHAQLQLLSIEQSVWIGLGHCPSIQEPAKDLMYWRKYEPDTVGNSMNCYSEMQTDFLPVNLLRHMSNKLASSKQRPCQMVETDYSSPSCIFNPSMYFRVLKGLWGTFKSLWNSLMISLMIINFL